MTGSTGDFYGWEVGAFQHDHHVIFSLYSLMFLVLILLSFIFQHIITVVFKFRVLPEVGVVILVGMLIGGFLYLCGLSSIAQSIHDQNDGDNDTYYLGFSSNVFYFGFLPPIIFNSGYHLKRRFFFHNYDAILSLALLGTLISTIVMTYGLYLMQYYHVCGNLLASFSLIEFIAFAALISSTDPVSTLAVFSSLKVEPLLYYVVFGESILNDSIAIIVFKTAARYITQTATNQQLLICLANLIICFLGSSIIGYVMGICLAILYRFIDFHDHIIVSIAIFLIVVYLPFFLCEVLQLSGVVSILYAGIASRRYITKNISEHEKYMISFLVQFIAGIADTACFALLGISTFTLFFVPTSSATTFEFWGFGGILVLIVFGLCQLGRAVHVYPLMGMVNLARMMKARRQGASSKQPLLLLKSADCHMIFFAGLRGAVAFALANIFPNDHGNKSLVVGVTTAIVMITVFVQGGLTETLIKCLKIPMGVNMTEYLRSKKLDLTTTESDFERKYLYPLIVRKPSNPLHIMSPEVGFNDYPMSTMSVASSGGGTLYDGNHGHHGNTHNNARSTLNPFSPNIDDYQDAYELKSHSAKRSIEVTTPRVLKNQPTKWSHDSSPNMSIGYASLLASAIAAGDVINQNQQDERSSLHHDDHMMYHDEVSSFLSSLHPSDGPYSRGDSVRSTGECYFNYSPAIIQPISIDNGDSEVVEADIESLIHEMQRSSSIG